MPIANQNPWARFKSQVMYCLCVAFTLAILSILVLVIGYLVSIGWRSVNWDFYSKLPKPYGAEGYPGGMANGLLGTAALIGLASLVGIPIGMLAGIFLSEYGANSKLTSPVRVVAGVLAGGPSIVVGVLGYELLVGAVGDYNGWGGAPALAF